MNTASTEVPCVFSRT